MTILITGGAGFIGSNLAEFLSKEDKVIILDNLSSGKIENLKEVNVEFIKGDIRDYNTVLSATKGVNYIFHLAAIASVQRSIENPEECFDINIKGTLNILKAAKENSVKKIIFSSSSAIYGNNPILPKKEDMLPEPLSPYAISKNTAEQLLQTFQKLYGIPYVNLRYFNVYGPKQDNNSQYSGVISLFINNALHGKPLVIYGDGKVTRDFIYVKDVVLANMLATKSDVVGTFNIGSGSRTTIKELAEKIIKLTNSSSKIIFKEGRAGEVKHSVSSIDKAKKELQWEPTTDLSSGLKPTIEHYSSDLRNKE